MAIHDIWSFDNAPVGVALTQSGTTDITGVQGSTNPYFNYTGNPGMIYPTTTGTGQNVAVTSDGFLTFTRSTSGTSDALIFQLAQVQTWSTTGKYWIGFRTKASYQPATSNTGNVFHLQQSFASNNLVMLTEADLTSIAANTECYVEILIDNTAATYTIYLNGVLLRSAATSSYLNAGSYYLLDAGNGGANPASSTRSYRDFYFIDVDATYTTRLGPIRSSVTTLSNISGSGYTLNSSADLPTALTTTLQNPPVTTPSATSSAANQAITCDLNTSLAAGTRLIGMQAYASMMGSSSTDEMDLTIGYNSQTLDAGVIIEPNGAMNYNQRWGLQTKAADGSIWTPNSVNSTVLTLTAKTIPAVNTVVLLHGIDGTGSTTIVDTAGNANGTVNGSVGVGSTAQTLFGQPVLSFPGAFSASVTIPDIAALQFGTADFTIECFVYFTTKVNCLFFSKGTASSSYTPMQNDMGEFYTYMASAPSTSIALGGGLTASTWHHVALVKASGVLYGLLDGEVLSSVTNSGTEGNLAGLWYIGSTPASAGTVFTGYMREIRFSKIARYTAAYTVPTAPFVLD